MEDSQLRQQVEKIATKAQLTALAVAAQDLETGRSFRHQADRWFHAASTFKVAILLALLKAAAEGTLDLDDHLHVRNTFRSVLDSRPYWIDPARDGDAMVHQRTGRSLALRQLATRMITHSSNLATNLLLDFLTPEQVRRVLAAGGVQGVKVQRGVEDLTAHEHGINNEATAAGLEQLFRLFQEETFLPPAQRETGLGILLAQEFNGMIPARLPKGIRVAHKTGEISTHSHDAGLVFPPGRCPYLVAILTESEPQHEGRSRAVAEISAALYEYFTGGRA